MTPLLAHCKVKSSSKCPRIPQLSLMAAPHARHVRVPASSQTESLGVWVQHCSYGYGAKQPESLRRNVQSRSSFTAYGRAFALAS